MSESRPYDEQLPWLQPVDDEDEQRGISARKMLAALVVVLLAALIIAAGFFWMGRREAAVSSGPELIRAPAGPYKIRPPNPGGLDISGDSQTAFETSAGHDPDAQLDTSKLPAGTTVQPPNEVPKALPANETKTPVVEEKPVAPTATGATGSIVQLGAFGNRAQAERAWTALSSRFPTVAAASKMVVPFPGGIRLRAGTGSPGDARQLCATLKAAGENCFVAQ